MNNLNFYIDDNDNIINCIYNETIDGYIKEKIILPQEKLQEIFKKYIKKYPNFIEKIEDNYIIFSFNDIDINEIDKIRKESIKYKKELQEKQKQTNINESNKSLNPINLQIQYNQNNNKKLHQKNKFNQKTIIASTLVVTSLLTFALAKKIEKNKQNTQEITYTSSETYIEPQIPISKTTQAPIQTTPTIEPTPSQIPIIQTPSPSQVPTTPTPKIEEIVPDNQCENVIQYEELTPNYTLSLATDNQSESEKFFVTKSYYKDFVTKIANEYGLPGEFMLAVGCHENQIHNETVSKGGGIGLFQIQVEGPWNWLGKTVTGYNFSTKKWEKIQITFDEKTGYYNVSDLEINTRVACIIMQNSLINENYDIAKGTTEYNYGNPNTNTVINTWCENEKVKEERNNPENLDWLKYRSIIQGGDIYYLENVFKYIPDDSILTFVKPNYETVTIKFNNLNLERGILKS